MENDTDTPIFKSNVTVSQVMEYFNISMAKLNITNDSEVSQIHLFDLFEAYETKEREQLMTYKFVAYVLGTLIVISNLIVVVSSGLILKKGQQPKSTYLLLGNVSLADTIIGVSVIFGASVDSSMRSDPLCIFQLAMLVCPAMVSIFSVGLIAIDRYIFILHGLYYQRWFNTTRVRIGILCIWMIAVQPKSTYMLLGNISLADSILGVAMVLSSLVDKAITTGAPLQEDSESISIHTVCMIVQALRMCPAVVSILSIGFIAADRYVYLIHGLYYKTWISTKRVRISIACIWIAGILFTIPGWVNINNVSRCYFIEIFPTGLMLTLTALSFINITFVTTLYTIILVKAVKANNKIQKAKKIAKISQKEKISNNITYNLSSDNNNTHNIHFTVLDVEALESDQKISIDENKNENTKQSEDKIPEMIQNTTMENPDHSTNNKLSDPSNNTNLNRSVSSYIDLNKIQNKCKENKKCRAITVVILTTGSFIITWVPFLMSVVYYGFICEKYNTKHYCEMSCQYVIRPLWALALLNSLLNPFIYAWWHHGFKDYVRSCYKKCFRR
ncbi:octopamine receptor isoform X1 [Amyelois transitella]|uniref:octopamine receptor isoform X1 n=1 Tax=Amyelois transitella TaxID=680683 RepID=UPI0029903B5F|nr:octopamine receptor isoform X1 [Amyelois transitella]